MFMCNEQNLFYNRYTASNHNDVTNLAMHFINNETHYFCGQAPLIKNETDRNIFFASEIISDRLVKRDFPWLCKPAAKIASILSEILHNSQHSNMLSTDFSSALSFYNLSFRFSVVIFLVKNDIYSMNPTQHKFTRAFKKISTQKLTYRE